MSMDGSLGPAMDGVVRTTCPYCGQASHATAAQPRFAKAQLQLPR